MQVNEMMSTDVEVVERNDHLRLAGVSGNRRSCGVEPLLPPGF